MAHDTSKHSPIKDYERRVESIRYDLGAVEHHINQGVATPRDAFLELYRQDPAYFSLVQSELLAAIPEYLHEEALESIAKALMLRQRIDRREATEQLFEP